jgi:hypothetical protein
MLPTPWDISAHLDMEFAASAAAAAAAAAAESLPADASPDESSLPAAADVDARSCTPGSVLKNLPEGSTWLGQWSGHGGSDDVRAIMCNMLLFYDTAQGA